jgi:hypothetical protein
MATPKGRRAPDASIIGASRPASPRKRQIGWLADEAPMELFNRFERETGIRILKVYGMTEGGVLLDPQSGHRSKQSRLDRHQIALAARFADEARCRWWLCARCGHQRGWCVCLAKVQFSPVKIRAG